MLSLNVVFSQLCRSSGKPDVIPDCPAPSQDFPDDSQRPWTRKSRPPSQPIWLEINQTAQISLWLAESAVHRVRSYFAVRRQVELAPWEREREREIGDTTYFVLLFGKFLCCLWTFSPKWALNATNQRYNMKSLKYRLKKHEVTITVSSIVVFFCFVLILCYLLPRRLLLCLA